MTLISHKSLHLNCLLLVSFCISVSFCKAQNNYKGSSFKTAFKVRNTTTLTTKDFVTSIYYKSMNDYDKGQKEECNSETHFLDPTVDPNKEMDKKLTEFLTSKGVTVIDTLDPLFNEKQVYYIIKPAIYDRKCVDVGSSSKFERQLRFTTRLSVYNNFDEQIFEFEWISYTGFVKCSSAEDFEKLVNKEEMYSKLFDRFYTNDDFVKIMDKVLDKEIVKDRFEHWPLLDLKTTKAKDTLDQGDFTNSSVTIENGEFKGSGFLISDEGHIITTSVNLNDKETVSIIYEGKKYEASLLRKDDDTRLCLLKSDIVPTSVMKISTGKPFGMAATIFIIATLNNDGMENTVSKGIVSGKRKFYNIDYIQTDARINKGNSGGAMINEAGQLLGVVIGKMTGRNVEGLGFAVSAKYITEKLKINFTK